MFLKNSVENYCTYLEIEGGGGMPFIKIVYNDCTMHVQHLDFSICWCKASSQENLTNESMLLSGAIIATAFMIF